MVEAEAAGGTAVALHIYRQMLEAGVCPEQARMVLPQNTMTEWIWSGTLGAFADMCRLRLDPHAQYESRLVAQEVAEEMKQLYPVSWKALLEDNK
jgi:thymidylate synthase (FAD)